MNSNPISGFRYMGGESFYGLDQHEKMIVAPQIKVGTTIYDNQNNPYKLIKEINYGGEGTIYETDKLGVVCKIYNDQSRNNLKESKINKIIESNIKFDNICFPKTIVYTKQKVFLGYLMPLAKGKKLGKLFFPKKEVLNEFKTYTRIDLIQLCLSILSEIKQLHDHNILIGDINDNNFMFVNPNEVYAIDTDSYQIDKYPCPVGTPDYISPELASKKGRDGNKRSVEGFKYFFRVWNDEYYAIAVLLFKILMLGTRPYTKANASESTDTLSQKYIFPYTMDINQTNNNFHPDHHCKNIWSYFPQYIKKAFIDTFSGINKTQRISPIEWINLFTLYESHLKKDIQKIDKKSLVLYPDTFIDYSKLENITAKLDVTFSSFNLSNCIKNILPNKTEKEFNKILAQILSTGKYIDSHCNLSVVENRGIFKTVSGSVTQL